MAAYRRAYLQFKAARVLVEIRAGDGHPHARLVRPRKADALAQPCSIHYARGTAQLDADQHRRALLHFIRLPENVLDFGSLGGWGGAVRPFLRMEGSSGR